MNVVPLPVTDMKDVAAQLRKMADYVEGAPFPMTCVMVLGYPDGEVVVYGWGARASGLETQGWLARAQTHCAGNVHRNRRGDDVL